MFKTYRECKFDKPPYILNFSEHFFDKMFFFFIGDTSKSRESNLSGFL